MNTNKRKKIIPNSDIRGQEPLLPDRGPDCVKKTRDMLKDWSKGCMEWKRPASTAKLPAW